MTLRERIKITPAECRMWARKDGGTRLMTNDDLAKASGLARSTICKISHMQNWDRLPMATADAFSQACGIDLLAPSRRRDKRLVREGRLSLIRNSAPAQRGMLDRMINDLAGSQRTRQATCSSQA